MQKEDDSKIYAASKNLFSFDQARVVHEATTDYANVVYLDFIPSTCSIVTASEKNVIVWDSLIGSKLFTNTNICAHEITSCCLDDRKRKILLGDVHGHIGVHNCSNGQLMKKATRLQSSIPGFAEHFKNMRCSGEHGHVVIQSTQGDEKLSKIASKYTDHFCALVSLVARTIFEKDMQVQVCCYLFILIGLNNKAR